ncbi:MAG: leucyl aminopeptidase [Candidatus Moraniibacteriota bacterium]
MNMKMMTGSVKGSAKKWVRVERGEGRQDEVFRMEDGSQKIMLGVPEPEKIQRRKLILLARRIIATAKAKNYESLIIDPKIFSFENVSLFDQELGELVATNFLMANYSFTELLTTPKEGFPQVKEILFENATKEFGEGVKRGTIIGEEVNACRRLANLPGGDVTPETLANEAKKIAKQHALTVKILGVAEMKKLGMGGVLGVGKGSDFPSKFIILEYMNAPKSSASGQGKKGVGPVVLVGKGVTFDTGGINLKPSNSMVGMNMDMSGGSAVMHTVAAIARLKVKCNLVALVPAVENMPSGKSYRPGDVLRSMSGKTIEVGDTDAEGRVILADALTYASKYKPSLVIDVATLTGAAVVARGERASALFTTDEKLEKQFRELGELSGDFVWPLPLWEEYDEEIKGTVGDWSNIGKTRYGGAITAAAFLRQFAVGYPWVHLDIAPRMTSIEGEFLAKGAAGTPVRLLVKLLEGR